MTGYSQQVWDGAADLRAGIHALPFNRGLADGTLSRDRFLFYIMQDALYLAEYARVLSLAAARAPDSGAAEVFARSAHQTILVERALHERYFALYGADPDRMAEAEPSPACLGYTSFLLATGARDGFAELVAALLPCFWIYWDVGTSIDRAAAPGNPYRMWIDTYSDPGFGAAVSAVIDVFDRAAGQADSATRDAMRRAFNRSARYEWLFWDSAWRLEAWPVGTGADGRLTEL